MVLSFGGRGRPFKARYNGASCRATTEHHTPAMTDFNNELLAFLGASPTPFHACAQMATRLEAAGFQRLHEQNAWNLAPGRYYVLRNDSSLIAFVRGTVDPTVGGIRMVGAHTDSPCLRLKPKPEAIDISASATNIPPEDIS